MGSLGEITIDGTITDLSDHFSFVDDTSYNIQNVEGRENPSTMPSRNDPQTALVTIQQATTGDEDAGDGGHVLDPYSDVLVVTEEAGQSIYAFATGTRPVRIAVSS